MLPLLAIPLLLASGPDGCVESAEPGLAAISSALTAATAGPDLPNTPSPATFADAWALRFEEVVRAAAASDARLSKSEAYRIAEKEGFEKLFSDDAVKILGSQSTMSVAKVVELAKKRAFDKAVIAAGPDGKLSLTDGGEKIDATLRKDFLWLRGKLALPASRTDEELRAVVAPAVLAAIDDGTAVELGVPWNAAGRKPLIERLDHPASNTWGDVYLIDGVIWWSRAAGSPTPLVGWWKIGPVPPPAASPNG